MKAMFDYDKVRFPTYRGKVEHHAGITIRASDREAFHTLKRMYGKKKAYELFGERVFPTVPMATIRRHFR